MSSLRRQFVHTIRHDILHQRPALRSSNPRHHSTSSEGTAEVSRSRRRGSYRSISQRQLDTGHSEEIGKANRGRAQLGHEDSNSPFAIPQQQPETDDTGGPGTGQVHGLHDDTAASFNGIDFVMPQLVAPENLTNGGEDGSGNFVLAEVAGAIQDGESAARVQNYLAFYSDSVIQANINGYVADIPAIFYVVQSRDLAMIRLWAKYGGDVNATATFAPLVGVPLLAFAAGLGGSPQNDATEIFTTLLSLGARPCSIPRAFFSPYQRDLPVDGPAESEMPELTETRLSWCTEDVRKMLAARLNLRQRYYLNMASTLPGPGVRARQVTAFTDAGSLLGVPFSLIGQTPASQFLIKRLLRLLARPSKEPAVMVFAGPSGHGKTELARKLG